MTQATVHSQSLAMPVTLIGGYLGSGKTTLVNHVLRHANGSRLAILVNDFGELPIDADLIEAQDGDVISLSGGCVCCSYGDDLQLSMQNLVERSEPPDHVIIEASGVALPGSIGKTLSLLRSYQLEGIVVLADATSVMHLAQEKYIGDTIMRQLSEADLVVLNKLDLLDVEQTSVVRSWIAAQFPQTPIIDIVNGALDPSLLFEIKQDKTQLNTDQQADLSHNLSVFASLSFSISEPRCAQSLASQLADRHCRLIRAKGFVLDIDRKVKTIQVVGRRWSVTAAPANVSTGLVCIAKAEELSESRIRSFCQLQD